MSEWTDYTPGKTPIPDGYVDVSLRDGELHVGVKASDLNWRDIGERSIAQYRCPSRAPDVRLQHDCPQPATTSARKADALSSPITAPAFCQKAVDLMAERGKTYDKGGKSERSMAATVAAFNAITGRDLSEPEGWLLMSLVKRVRQYQNPAFHRDSAEDAVAYAALEAEALAAEEAA